MNIKSLISESKLIKLIHPLVYVFNMIIIIILLIFTNTNVYKTIIIQGEDIKKEIKENPSDINMQEFNIVVERINAKKTINKLNIKEIF